MVNLGLSRILGLERAYVARLYFDLPTKFLQDVVVGRDAVRRSHFWNRWGFVPLRPQKQDGPLIWVDVLSGGEVMQIHSFIRHLKEMMPDSCVLVSSNNTYSYNVARTTPGVHDVFYTPWDLRHVVRRVVRRLRPSVLVCIENLPFPVLVREAQAMGVKTVLCSGFMSKKFDQHETLRRTMPLNGYLHLDFVGAKSKEDAEGFERIGVRQDRISLVDNMRFDVGFHRLNGRDRSEWKQILRISDDYSIIVAGSVRTKEESVVLEAFAQIKHRRPKTILLLAPSFFSPDLDIEAVAARFGLTTWRRSRIDEMRRLEADVLIIDTFGELSRLYAIADIIFIGGSINPASHLGYGNNIIEPLVHGRPIFFGPFMNRWLEITEALKSVYPGLEVRDAEGFALHALTLMSQPETVAALQKCAEAIVAEHRDAPLKNALLVRDVACYGKA